MGVSSILLTQAEAFLEEVPVHTDKYDGECEQDKNANIKRDIARAEKSIAETVDKVEDRIEK